MFWKEIQMQRIRVWEGILFETSINDSIVTCSPSLDVVVQYYHNSGYFFNLWGFSRCRCFWMFLLWHVARLQLYMCADILIVQCKYWYISLLYQIREYNKKKSKSHCLGVELNLIAFQISKIYENLIRFQISRIMFDVTNFMTQLFDQTYNYNSIYSV